MPHGAACRVLVWESSDRSNEQAAGHQVLANVREQLWQVGLGNVFEQFPGADYIEENRRVVVRPGEQEWLGDIASEEVGGNHSPFRSPVLQVEIAAFQANREMAPQQEVPDQAAPRAAQVEEPEFLAEQLLTLVAKSRVMGVVIRCTPRKTMVVTLQRNRVFGPQTQRHCGVLAMQNDEASHQPADFFVFGPEPPDPVQVHGKRTRQSPPEAASDQSAHRCRHTHGSRR
jgi:hypothetical protein